MAGDFFYAWASDRNPDDAEFFSINVENDIVANTDRGYTNGFRISYLSAENQIPAWVLKQAQNLPFFAQQGTYRASFALGQNIYTPRDLSRRDVITDDRPYAGWLYGSIGLLSDRGDRLDNLQLSLGVVGPASGAEVVQEFVHDNFRGDDPNGWDNQLENELGIVLFYERAWRNFFDVGLENYTLDFAPHTGFAVGNVYTYAAAGGTFRFGSDLPADYGPPRIRPSLPGSDFFLPSYNKPISWYLFAGLEGRVVARNIFLDGNSFEDSHSVDKRFLTGDLQLGISVIIRDTRISYTHTIRSKEFKEDKSDNQFGVIALSIRL